jgi:hypothetical protein
MLQTYMCEPTKLLAQIKKCLVTEQIGTWIKIYGLKPHS